MSPPCCALGLHDAESNASNESTQVNHIITEEDEDDLEGLASGRHRRGSDDEADADDDETPPVYAREKER